MDFFQNTLFLRAIILGTILILQLIGVFFLRKYRFWNAVLSIILPFFVVLPISFLPGHIDAIGNTWFAYAKLISLGASVATLFAISLYPTKTLFKYLRAFLLAINISEGVLGDVTLGNILNALTGALLIITLPSIESLVYDKKTQRILWSTPWSWILGYSLWNFSFISSYYPELLLFHVLHVGIPLLLCLKQPYWYTQVRAITLTIAVMVLVTFWPWINRLQVTPPSGLEYVILLTTLLGMTFALKTFLQPNSKRLMRFFS